VQRHLNYATAKCYKRRVRTEGHRLLKASGASRADVVRKTGRTFPTVKRWFEKGKPDIDSAVVLEREFGIPVGTWAQRAKKAS
jgi:hypothetical protein